jgi:multiple sugar transport system substrate-binding protein
VSFIPAADVELKRQAAEFGQLAGVDVTVELINFNDLNPRIASGIETKAGPDIIQMHNNWSHLYGDGLADVDDVAEEIDRRDGGMYDLFRNVTFVGGRWKAVPMGTSTATFAYRTDWFKEAGAAKFPDTWDEFRKVGAELKKKGRPMGQALGHSVGDPNGWAYSVTWGFGGQEVDKDQKTVLINS